MPRLGQALKESGDLESKRSKVKIQEVVAAKWAIKRGKVRPHEEKCNAAIADKGANRIKMSFQAIIENTLEMNSNKPTARDPLCLVEGGGRVVCVVV